MKQGLRTFTLAPGATLRSTTIYERRGSSAGLDAACAF
jgi:hypothetical protein